VSIAWSEYFEPDRLQPFPALPLPEPASEWAWGGADGSGVKVAVIDSGVDVMHPLVGGVAGSVAFEPDPDEPWGHRAVDVEARDLAGHGTACAGIIRALAPEAEIWSVRVLGESMKGRSAVFAASMDWVVAQGFDVANLSLSTANRDWFGDLHGLADSAFFGGTVLVCAVNNVYRATYPSEFAAVVSVATGGGPGTPLSYNVAPPAEFGAPGVDVQVAWLDGGTATVSGNSFAAAHVSGLAALIRSKHRGLPPHAVKALLAAAASNARPVGASSVSPPPVSPPSDRDGR
jgi:subtilisin family serine protease